MHKGYTYVGEKDSVLGKFESIIDNLLVNVYNTERMYSEGFSFNIVDNPKGALIGSKEQDSGLFYDFLFGTGSEFSAFLSDHPYTEVLKDNKYIKDKSAFLHIKPKTKVN